MSHLRVESLHANLDGAPFLRDISFDVATRALHVLLGPSGCGKTTLLKTLAGLHPAAGGRVLLDDRDVTQAPPERRNLVLIHQESTLFPHLRVAENVSFGLRLRHRPPHVVRQRIADLLQLVDLDGFDRRRVHGLSGGEKQRVALARALAVEPAVLLLDEPFSALDRSLRQSLRADVKRILQDQGITALFVTHDQEEAFSMADALLVMNEGRLVDEGPVPRVFHQPASPAAARALGRRNLWRYEPGDVASIRTPLGTLRVADATGRPDRGWVLYREEDLRLEADPDGPGRVDSVQFLGTRTLYVIKLQASSVFAESGGAPTLRAGDRVRVAWEEARPLFYASET